MPGHDWNGDREALLGAGLQAGRRVKSAWDNFLEFISRDNVLEVAVGLILASAFSAVVNSLVSDLLLPPISLLPFMNRNLAEKFAVLRKGPHAPYNTLEQATDDGAVTMAYGLFIDKTIKFFVIGLSLYAIANIYGFVSHDSIIKHTVRCPYCKKFVSQKAKRCATCTSWLDGREDREGSALHED